MAETCKKLYTPIVGFLNVTSVKI